MNKGGAPLPARADAVPSARTLERGAALASAAVVAVGVLGFGWSSFLVVGLYWLENVLIGVFTLARMAAAWRLAGRPGGTGVGALVFLMGFFTVHYGMFCFGHGVFVVSLLGSAPGAPMPALPNPFVEIPSQLLVQPLGWAAVAAVALFVGGDFVRWLADARRGRLNPAELMLAPYRRIVVLHVALLGGAFALHVLDLPQATVLLLVLLKLAFDLREVRRPFTFAWRRTA